MELTMTNQLEEHDDLYRQAYKKYTEMDLAQAKRLATAAFDKAKEYFRARNHRLRLNRLNCRAEALLQMIERRSLLVKDQ